MLEDLKDVGLVPRDQHGSTDLSDIFLLTAISLACSAYFYCINFKWNARFVQEMY
jgi:hypothetical protein